MTDSSHDYYTCGSLQEGLIKHRQLQQQRKQEKEAARKSRSLWGFCLFVCLFVCFLVVAFYLGGGGLCVCVVFFVLFCFVVVVVLFSFVCLFVCFWLSVVWFFGGYFFFFFWGGGGVATKYQRAPGVIGSSLGLVGPASVYYH